ncbi:glycosyltransferase involved in cell wall biosynthesis [Paucimonas lemoignei]|uniref:Glycosyltransferase involved in cell wall biosynthesis n=1 Tax=Paucimonas lemoignei TaxID=29443 RepID=A0A4R3HQG2_PAULE|nr:glycosyltransferase family 4 protein [Paucimonas lemoignei]TCS34313.1 glycosyltransferase involved in cell wall biosynthesis [Paucimonas lemoignei]
MMNQTVVISVNTAWNVYNFRAGLIKSLIGNGYEVVVVAPEDDYASRLTALGCRFIHMPMDNNGTHPGRDFALLMRYLRVLRDIRPLAFLGYTIKPNVYGSIAAHVLGIPVINNIAGLGTAFINKSLVTHVVKELYRFSLRRSRKVFFQNADDQRLFMEAGLVRHHVADLLPGSGIDLTHYLPEPVPPLENRPFRFLLVARMLKAKGVEEYVAAASIARQQFPNIEFQMLGFVDKANPDAISLERIQLWEKNGLVRYFGKTDDVRPYMAQADCIVLPSYREGVPHSLLEAAAMARPIIATNVAGCRDIVEHELNGLLCDVKDPQDLAAKMLQMYQSSAMERYAMGMAGRRKVISEFDERIVILKYLDMIGAISAARVKGRENPKAVST